MKSTRQPRLEALAAGGTAPIQLTSTWEDYRLRNAIHAVGPLAANVRAYLSR